MFLMEVSYICILLCIRELDDAEVLFTRASYVTYVHTYTYRSIILKDADRND